MTVTWLLLAAGLALAGSAARGDHGLRPPRTARPPVSPRALQWLGGAAVAGGCVASVGVPHGAIAAVAAVPIAVAGISRLQARPQRARANPSLALALDLVAVALAAGRPLSAALVLAAPAAGGSTSDQLTRVGGLLRLGADPIEAWREVSADPVLAPVAAAARRSATSGIRLAGAFEQLAVELRAGLRAGAEARAQRAGVLVAAPLGLCFLPSFVCLGIVPIVVGVAGGMLGGMA